jgi:Phage integrase SAM-like domain
LAGRRGGWNKKTSFFCRDFIFSYICTPERKGTAVGGFSVGECPGGEIGRRTVFRSQRGKPCAGSNPVLGTIKRCNSINYNAFFFLLLCTSFFFRLLSRNKTSTQQAHAGTHFGSLKAKMNIKIVPRLSRNKEKLYYTVSWGMDAGQRIATGIFTFTHPINSLQRKHNKEALHFLEIKRSQLSLDRQAIGTAVLPAHRLKANFLDFYEDFVRNNRQIGNRHLEGSLLHFKSFLKKKYLSPIAVTEELAAQFRKYLLDRFNGDTPANYFSRFKKSPESRHPTRILPYQSFGRSVCKGKQKQSPERSS